MMGTYNRAHPHAKPSPMGIGDMRTDPEWLSLMIVGMCYPQSKQSLCIFRTAPSITDHITNDTNAIIKDLASEVV
jgi:hypothetical protein